MLTIRLFEQRVAREFRTGEIPGFVHMYIGEEAVAAGVCANLDDDDYVTSTHRGHGHCIAKGCDLGPMMAEIYGREDGLCKGRGGSMHIADFSRGMLGANAIVGGGIALATGAGLALERPRQRPGRGRVLRRRRREPGRPPREPQPRRDLEAARDLRLREQRLRRVDAGRLRDERARRREPRAGYGIPGVVADGADVLGSTQRRARRSSGRGRERGRRCSRSRRTASMGHFEGDPDRYRDDEERARRRERDAIGGSAAARSPTATRPRPSSTRMQRRDRGGRLATPSSSRGRARSRIRPTSAATSIPSSSHAWRRA